MNKKEVPINQEYWQRNDSRNEWGDDDSQQSPLNKAQTKQNDIKQMPINVLPLEIQQLIEQQKQQHKTQNQTQEPAIDATQIKNKPEEIQSQSLQNN
eukprot:403338262